MKRPLFLIILTLILSQLTAQSYKKSICLIQTLNGSGRTVGQFSAVFIDKTGSVLTHRNNFMNAASAQIITQDSTIHRLVTIAGEDKITGLVKIKIDNNLSRSFSPLNITDNPVFDNKNLKLLIAESYNSIKETSISVAQMQSIYRYGTILESKKNI